MLDDRTPAASGWIRSILRNSDILLAVAVLAIVALMLVRVPPLVLDFLIATNISIAVIVLLVALYAPEAVRLPSFPTILLLATLFRLGLNVSSTRLILLNGDAGSIIDAFGNFVVGGNPVVGAIVFVVLVVIQFIVISKGAERVATVSARFSLDALPGKQMAIDAAVGAGSLTDDEAKEKRELLDRESKLYGAMEGAMKFVKGDAIAGIVISIVNILGGLLVGMRADMSPGESLEKYGLLTIGDGLVSQIPALVLGVAAGLVVTRVASDQKDSGNLARDMVIQLLENPRSLLLSGLLFLGIAASSPITGFPWLPFSLIGGVVLFLYFRPMPLEALRGGSEDATEAAVAAEPAPAGQQAAAAAGVFVPRPIVLEFDPGIGHLLDGSGAEELDEAEREPRVVLSSEMGFPFPSVHHEPNHALEEGCWLLKISGATAASGTADESRVFVCCLAHVAVGKGLEAEETLAFGPTSPMCTVPASAAGAARDAGLRVLSARQAAMKRIVTALRAHAHELLDVQLAANLIEALKSTHLDLVQSVIPTTLKVHQVADVLRALLRERVPIRNLPQILASLARHAGERVPIAALTEHVRQDIGRYICDYFASVDGKLGLYQLSPELEDEIRRAALGEPLTGAREAAIARIVAGAVDPTQHGRRPPVLIVDEDIRVETHKLLAPELPELVVLSRAELDAGYELFEIACAEEGKSAA